jgi:anaerobic selenocysteine-containing dehydrogenase
MERQRRAEGAPALEMNDEDAARRGLSDGQRVVIRNNQGSLQAGLKVTQQIRSGTVSLAGKWWSHPNETAAVGNLLTPATWSSSGQPAYNDTFVEVERVELHGPTASH